VHLTGATADQPEGPAASNLALPVRRRWLAPLLGVGLLLGLVSAVLQLAKDRGFDPPSLQLDRLLSVDEDLSVMNWLTASTFLLGGLVAWAVAVKRLAGRIAWTAAAAALALISLDEAAGVHDPLSVNAERQLRAGGLRAVAVLLVVALVGGAVVRFVLQLDPPVRWRVAGALGLLLVAALGVDAAGKDLVDDPLARLQPGYVAKSTIEEVLELGAAVLVLDGMLVAALTR
jgi:hypothetical protein